MFKYLQKALQLYKNLYFHVLFYEIHVFCCKGMKKNSHNKNHCGVLTLFPLKEYVRNSQKFKQHKDLMIYYIIQKRFLLKILFLCF